jgi:hypothetical protein
MHSTQKTAWEIGQTDGRVGTGNWDAFDRPLEHIYRAAEDWKEAVRGVSRPWLCWNLSDSWCLLQQKLIRAVGWTPVVGWDPSNGTGKPPVVPEAIAIDFNARLRFPALWVHVPLEFAFLWTSKLAFWHADLLLPLRKLDKAVRMFDALADGEVAAVFSHGGLRGLHRIRSYRYWEVLGCTTHGASEDQFRRGCGWWRHIARHPNCPGEAERRRRQRYSYDHGVGIRYWERRYGGRVQSIPERWISEGHFGAFSVPDYKRAASKAEEMALNFDLKQICARFGLEAFL